MTAHRLVVISCNGCGANIDYDAWGATAEESRANWVGAGWHFALSGGRDICAECWAAGIR